MGAGAGHGTGTAAATFGGSRCTLGHNTVTAQNDALDGQPGFRVAGQRLVAHGLGSLETPHGVAGLLRNGLVYVGGHGKLAIRLTEIFAQVRLNFDHNIAHLFDCSMLKWLKTLDLFVSSSVMEPALCSMVRLPVARLLNCGIVELLNC